MQLKSYEVGVVNYSGPPIKWRAIIHYYQIGNKVEREYLIKILAILLVFSDNSIDF